MNKKEMLRKLKELSEKGFGGEKINARKKLDELMRKNGITEDELEDNVRIECEFDYSTIRERRLLGQIAYKVLDSKDNIYTFLGYAKNGARKRKFGCKATLAQKIEIEFLFDFYRRLYKKEEEFFFDAFVQKHALFGSLKDGEEGNRLSQEELEKMYSLMDGMDDESPLKQIPEHTGK